MHLLVVVVGVELWGILATNVPYRIRIDTDINPTFSNLWIVDKLLVTIEYWYKWIVHDPKPTVTRMMVVFGYSVVSPTINSFHGKDAAKIVPYVAWELETSFSNTRWRKRSQDRS
jgi:hypothetical protein